MERQVRRLSSASDKDPDSRQTMLGVVRSQILTQRMQFKKPPRLAILFVVNTGNNIFFFLVVG